MRIAIPLADGLLAQHFGHCEKFALIDVDPVAKQITATAEVEAPEHQPGFLPRWLKDQGVTLVIAGGLGSRARALLERASVSVLTGAPTESATALAQRFLRGDSIGGENACDHSAAPHSGRCGLHTSPHDC
jgi:ATP-binding protein involved in chromosome partitioning